MNIGRRLRVRLVELAMSESDLAREMETSPSEISRLCRARECHTKTIARLAAALGVSPEYFLRDEIGGGR